MPLDCLGPLRGLHHPWPVLGALQCARRAQGFRMPLDCLGPLRGVHHPWPVLDALHVCAMCAWDTCPWTVLGLCVCGASPLAGLGRSAFWYACMCGCSFGTVYGIVLCLCNMLVACPWLSWASAWVVTLGISWVFCAVAYGQVGHIDFQSVRVAFP